MPTATEVRRVVATSAAIGGSQETVETISKHIGHLPETAYRLCGNLKGVPFVTNVFTCRYYRLFKGTLSHIKAHRIIAMAPGKAIITS